MKSASATCAVLLGLMVVVLPAQWEPDVRLTNATGESRTCFSPERCCAAIGATVHVVWADDRIDGTEEIFYKRSTDNGSTWRSDTALSTPSAMSFSDYPAIAVSGGNVHVVWHDDRDAGSPEWEIYYKRSTDGGVTWGADTRLTNASSASYYAAISVAGSSVHVVWYDYRDGNFEIYYKRSTDNGSSWGRDVRLTDNPGISNNPTITVLGSYVHVAWFDNRDGNCEIYYKRSVDNGSNWGADTRLTNEAANSYYTTLATSNNVLHVAWYDERDGNFEIYYKRSTDAGATWGADTRLTSDPAYSYEPSLAAASSNLHLTWEDQRDGNLEVYYKRSTDEGLTWGADTRLTSASGISHKSTVALSGTYIHVVWTDYRDSNWEIYYKRNPTGNLDVNERLGDSFVAAGRKLAAQPNPFVSSATIPGHERERVDVFDAAGRVVGTYQGGSVGADLAPGVYFIQLERRNAVPLRILKMK